MEVLAGIGLVIIVMFVSIPLFILNGAVLMKLWAWFLVPLGLPSIDLAHAIGVSIIISYMTNHVKENKDHDQDTWRTIIASVFKPLFALLFGYIVHSFM